jgi:antitoxin HigA-1
MLNNRKRRPTHPGEILREDILPAAEMTQTELANRIGVSRRTVNEIIHERRPVTTDIAHRLARLFKTTPELWLNLQQAVDIWDELEANKKAYNKIKPLPKGKAA